jgi:hypothetical protein
MESRFYCTSAREYRRRWRMVDASPFSQPHRDTVPKKERGLFRHEKKRRSATGDLDRMGQGLPAIVGLCTRPQGLKRREMHLGDTIERWPRPIRGPYDPGRYQPASCRRVFQRSSVRAPPDRASRMSRSYGNIRTRVHRRPPRPLVLVQVIERLHVLRSWIHHHQFDISQPIIVLSVASGTRYPVRFRLPPVIGAPLSSIASLDPLSPPGERWVRE